MEVTLRLKPETLLATGQKEDGGHTNGSLADVRLASNKMCWGAGDCRGARLAGGAPGYDGA